MRVRVAGLLVVAVVGALIAEGAGAASYQKVDGTIVDPIRQFQYLNWLISGPPHSYSGPSLGPGADLSGALLQGANLRDANLVSANLSGANFRNVNLLGADLTAATIDGLDLIGAVYNQFTLFPEPFDPEAALMAKVTVVNNGLAPPNPDNVISLPTEPSEFNPYPQSFTYINNQNCDSTIEYPCGDPGAPTAVSGVGNQIVVSESSSFNGLLRRGGVTLRDSASAVVAGAQFGEDEELGFTVADSASLTVTACGTFCNLSSYGQSTANIIGWFEWVRAYDQSHVYHSGNAYHGDGVESNDESTIELVSSEISVLIANGGTVIVHPGSEAYYGVIIRDGGTVELRGGTLDPSQEIYGFIVEGELLMSSGSIGGYVPVEVPGYASLAGGYAFGEVRGIDEGLIEISGTMPSSLEPFALEARDQSRVRYFGADFAVNSTPTPLGSISTSEGVLSGTLASGDPINNPFAHRGADCGGQPCTGRVLVLAPGLDWDQDTVPNPFDNCAEEPNADQADVDSDGTGDVCFAPVDLDRDGIVDALDNCRVDENPEQLDTDADGVGDACEKNLIFWADKGLEGCTTPPQRLPYELVSNDLGNGDVIDRSSQACDCFGIEYPVTPGTASVRFLHRTESGFVEEYCENVAPYALGLGPNQPICADGLDEDGLHEVMATPYDAPGCEAGGGNALPSSIRSFTMAAPEPGLGLMVGVGVLGLAGISRLRTLRRRCSVQ